jgi:hypothetical protein
VSDTQGQGQETGTAQGGSSEPAPIEIPAGLAEAAGVPTQQPAQQQGTQQQGQDQYTPSELVAGLLKGVPPEQQAALEPYIKQWDAGVTRQFQQLQSQYSPYNQFIEAGVDPETIDIALQLADLYESNPQGLADLIYKNHGGGQGPGAQQQAAGGDQFENLHPDVQNFINSQQSQLAEMRQLMGAVAQNMTQAQQQQAQQAEDEQLDQYMGLLQQQFGDFDEDYVLAKMERGMDGADAVQAYQQLLQQGVNQSRSAAGGGGLFGANGQAAQVPPIVSGGSHSPMKRSITEASDAETAALVQQLLDSQNKT